MLFRFCLAVNTVQGCFFTLEGVGRVLRPEFRNRELQSGSSVDCKMSCIRSESTCKSVSFNEKTQTCYQSQLNQNSAPFELLAMVDLDFDTYIKGECIFNELGALGVTRELTNDISLKGGTGRILDPSDGKLWTFLFFRTPGAESFPIIRGAETGAAGIRMRVQHSRQWTRTEALLPERSGES